MQTERLGIGVIQESDLLEKLNRLKNILADMGSAAVAFSGGVDSTFLLKVAHDVLGDRCIGIVALSESYLPEEAEEARKLANQIGVECVFIETRELQNEQYASNPINRCYYCKKELFAKMFEVAASRGIKWLLYGANADDLGDFRPGSQAAKEVNARAPLVEAGITKAEIRELSRRLGLPTWNKPASACLASRVPYGTRITADILNRIASAERFLKQKGFTQVRVRHHSDIARIEVPREEFPRLLEGDTAAEIASKLKELGYVYVTLDLQGFRSGSMNEVLSKNKLASAGAQQ
jgi:uncharacterized protein